MIAFDADVLSNILGGNVAFVTHAAQIPIKEQCIPIIVTEEMIRGRFNVIRQAESGKAKISIERAYLLLENVFLDLQKFKILSYTSRAESLFQEWRQQRIRVGTHDIRIAATCIVHGATLISRNRRDYDRIPNLSVEYWG